ncbi:MAG: hypothetical protein CVU91_09295 [Firmicutes bacterium HGW-Firmicutes-16]|nr:MAG: hypothetical protein CVU91_09295 [Firmicutes bacterium HGW-Firmicutes-16]
MKCEKCNNEAVFHFQSNINGEKTEYHLCSDCAKSAGFGEMLDFRPRSMFESVFSEPFGLMDSFFKDPFASFGTLADGFFARRLLTPTLEAPSVNVAVGEPEKATETEAKAKDNIPRDAGEEFRRKRELFALRHQMRTAVRSEEFEKAAGLRDKIRELER